MKNEYTILTAGDASTLSTNVNNLIGRGWEPQGGVTVAETLNPDAEEADELWAQAMVKKTEA